MISENGNTNQLNNKNEQYSKKLAIIFIVEIGMTILSMLIFNSMEGTNENDMSDLDFMKILTLIFLYFGILISFVTTRHYVI